MHFKQLKHVPAKSKLGQAEWEFTAALKIWWLNINSKTINSLYQISSKRNMDVNGCSKVYAKKLTKKLENVYAIVLAR